MRRWAPWALLLLLVAGTLVVAVTDEGGPRSNAERVEHIASTVQCPTCRGQAVSDSASPAAANIRLEIARRVESGESDDEIRSYLADRFGDQILLTPPRSGLASLVWILPVAGGVAAAAGLVFAFRRWKRGWP